MNQFVNEALYAEEKVLKTHELPRLPYGYSALEPVIDARTMTLHHDHHHAKYVEKLNTTLQAFPHLREHSALWLLRNLDKVPAEVRSAVHHNAGGHVNHSLFWRAMTPGAASGPTGELLAAINQAFGGLAAFKGLFERAGENLFGAGWVWLARSCRGERKLEVMTTSGHDHPMMRHHFPILLNDVWEHAYYLRYESRRAEYLKAWWPLVDWEQAARCFEISDSSDMETLQMDGTPQL